MVYRGRLCLNSHKISEKTDGVTLNGRVVPTRIMLKVPPLELGDASLQVNPLPKSPAEQKPGWGVYPGDTDALLGGKAPNAGSQQSR
jgi:hypothetical protein